MVKWGDKAYIVYVYLEIIKNTKVWLSYYSVAKDYNTAPH